MRKVFFVSFTLAVMAVFMASALGQEAIPVPQSTSAVAHTLIIKAGSAEAKDKVITAGTPFTLDLIFNYKGGRDLTGGTFGVQLFSPDKSITSVTHRPVDTAGLFPSVQFLGEWNESFSALNIINLDKKEYILDGKLPDSLYVIFAGIKGIAPNKGDLALIRLNLQIDGQAGKLCVDSVGQGPNTDLDWLFSDGIKASFDGPFCLTIKK